MPVPKFYETMLPVLKVLSDGQQRNMTELIGEVKDGYFALTPEELDERVSNGRRRFDDRVSWGRTYLRKAGLIEIPERGQSRITELGKSVIEKNPPFIDVEFLTQYPSFQEFKSIARVKNVNTDINEVSSTGMTPDEKIETEIAEIRGILKSELIEKLRTGDPYAFERVLLKLFQEMGYGECIGTPKSNDGGIDGIIAEDELGLGLIHIQAKRYAADNKIREPEIRNFIGAMGGKVKKGIFVTTSSFDEKAREKALDAPQKIILIDADRLTDLLIDHNVGIKIRSEHQIKEINADFFEQI